MNIPDECAITYNERQSVRTLFVEGAVMPRTYVFSGRKSLSKESLFDKVKSSFSSSVQPFDPRIKAFADFIERSIPENNRGFDRFDAFNWGFEKFIQLTDAGFYTYVSAIQAISYALLITTKREKRAELQEITKIPKVDW